MFELTTIKDILQNVLVYSSTVILAVNYNEKDTLMNRFALAIGCTFLTIFVLISEDKYFSIPHFKLGTVILMILEWIRFFCYKKKD